MKGWGRKVRYFSETQGSQTFWRDVPGFCRDIPGVTEKLEKKKFVFNSGPKFLQENLHTYKIPRFGWGYLFLFLGGGGRMCQFYFYGRGGFL